MFGRNDANMLSLEEGMIYETVDKIYMDRAAKVLFEILEDGDNTVNLEGSKEYVHLRLNNIIKLHDENGERKPTIQNYYDLKLCDETNFKTPFEKEYYSLKKSRSQYCVDQHKEIYLQGTRDSELLKQDHAYITYEIWRCNDAIRKEGDPPCKP